MGTEYEVQDSIGLDEIVESRLREVITRIGKGKAEDIEPELKSLANLIDSYNHKEELLETLLNPVTLEKDSQQIRETLAVIPRNRADLETLRRKSLKLLERSIQLLLAASKKLYRISNGSEYSPEICGYCHGFGTSNGA